MKKHPSWSLCLIVATALTFATATSPPAHGSTILPFGPPATISTEYYTPPGLPIAEFTSFFNRPGHYSGYLRTQVYSDTGGYTFRYTLQNSSTSTDYLTGLTLTIGPATPSGGYGVANFQPPAGVPAMYADASDHVVGFDWMYPNRLTPGVYGDVVLITPFSAFAETDAGVLNGVGTPVRALTPVPEPTTLIAGALLLVPFASSALRLMRRNRKS